MSKEVEEAMERLERAQNDICYATLYSQEEQDKDIETVLNYIKELENKLADSKADLTSVYLKRSI